jgi:hypothetical protein
MDDEFTRRCDVRIENLEPVKKRCHMEKDMIGYYQTIGEINGITYARDTYMALMELKYQIVISGIK